MLVEWRYFAAEAYDTILSSGMTTEKQCVACTQMIPFGRPGVHIALRFKKLGTGFGGSTALL